MQIKQNALAQYLQRKIAPVFILIGQDNYLLEDSLNSIKSRIKNTANYEEKIITIQSPDDWNTVAEEANSYSLFSDTVLLNIFLDKKSIDAAGKKILTQYLNSINDKCFIILRAPNVPARQLTWLASHDQALLIVTYPLNSEAMKNWIASKLTQNSLKFEQNVPGLIHHYTQGNMLACAQVIEKISLTHEPNTLINRQQALEHLSNQCDHSLFELADACLLGQADKAIQIVRHAANNKTEAILVLWMLTQEIRNLLQLFHKIQHQNDIKNACNQLKIWPQRISLYQASIKKLNPAMLQQLLHYCYAIDERIKSNLNTQIWNALEKVALAISIGHFSGDVCAV
ncbi:MAG: DNA polymerase III subunit delta [Legionella sp.]|nr:DNA polymerase III subunit delta [Legionella sp.]